MFNVSLSVCVCVCMCVCVNLRSLYLNAVVNLLLLFVFDMRSCVFTVITGFYLPCGSEWAEIRISRITDVKVSAMFLQLFCYRLVGLVVRRPPRERKIPGSNPACAGIFSGSSHTSDLKIGTPVATLPGAWRCRISTGTGRPGVSIL